MRPLSRDTHPEIEKIQIEAYRRMPAWQKMRIVGDLNEAAQTVAMADIRRRHPAASEHECRMRLASRWIDAELMRKAFGWDPEKEGY